MVINSPTNSFVLFLSVQTLPIKKILIFRFDRSFIKEEIKRHLVKNCNQKINIDHCFDLFFTPYNLTYVYNTCHERGMKQKTDLNEDEKFKVCECHATRI